MKEQDAAHSFEKGTKKTAIQFLKENAFIPVPQVAGILTAMKEYVDQELAISDAKLTRLRSELQQKNELNINTKILSTALRAQLKIEIDEVDRLRSELQQKNEETTALKMKSEAQLQSYLYTTDTLTKKLKQERELRKELTWVAEFGYSVMSVNHPRLSEVKSIIEKAKAK